MTDILQLDPIALIILFIAGGGVIYVVNIFTKAQTVREREMWAAIQTMQGNIKEINDNWLATYKAHSERSNESVLGLSNNIAALTVQIAQLTATVGKSIESGASLQGASNLMATILKDGESRRSAINERQ
jgi:hypothetical protein